MTLITEINNRKEEKTYTIEERKRDDYDEEINYK